MKRIALLIFLVMGLCGLVWSQEASSDKESSSLGDVARKSRAEKPASSRKVWTDEDFPSKASAPSSAPASDAAPAETTANPDEKTEPAAAKPGSEDAVEKQKQLDEDWSSKINAVKAQLASLERELNILEREYRLKAATYYADAGNRLRDPKGWAETEQNFQDKNEQLKQQIADAKAQLDQLQEEARKAGASSRARE